MSDRVPALVIPIGARENMRAKALRYLLEGRVTVLMLKRNPQRVWAEVRGDGGMYHTKFHRGFWSCTCDAKRTNCSHITAVQMVTLPEEVKP